jgi:hypothetical protein
MDETELVVGFTKPDCPMCKGTGIVLEMPGSFPGIAGVTMQCDCMYMTPEEANQQIVDAARAQNATNGFPDEYDGPTALPEMALLRLARKLLEGKRCVMNSDNPVTIERVKQIAGLLNAPYVHGDIGGIVLLPPKDTDPTAGQYRFEEGGDMFTMVAYPSKKDAA